MLVMRAIMGALAAIAVGRTLQVVMPDRPRPMHDPQLGFQLPHGVDPSDLQGWSSFPSDHAVLFFALSTALFLWSRTVGVLGFIWASLIVCLPRIYRPSLSQRYHRRRGDWRGHNVGRAAYSAPLGHLRDNHAIRIGILGGVSHVGVLRDLSDRHAVL